MLGTEMVNEPAQIGRPTLIDIDGQQISQSK